MCSGLPDSMSSVRADDYLDVLDPPLSHTDPLVRLAAAQASLSLTIQPSLPCSFTSLPLSHLASPLPLPPSISSWLSCLISPVPSVEHAKGYDHVPAI